jgi:DNA processing protein
MTDPRDLGYAILLAAHPGVGPRRLSELLADRPAAGWRAVGGDPAADPLRALEQHVAAGVTTLLPVDPRYPERLRADHEHPAVLFAQGDLAALGDVRVAIVGTRRCTGAGAGFARELGRELTAAGVGVVSGLALGIDGAAHRGVLEVGGRPIGVVGSGLDVVYPARHRELWGRVREEGVLLSEAPLGTRPAAWRFPARNRVIAALAHLVVVVESHAGGGSMLTVKEAADRDIPVMAVPGSVRNPASAGTNRLIADGCAPVLDATDVLVALGLTAAARAAEVDRRPPPDGQGQAVLAAFDWEPATLEHLAVRTGFRLPELALALEGLLESGWVQAEGGWYERVAP